MKIRASIAALGTVAVLGVTGAVLLPGAAGARTVTHTLSFTAVQQVATQYSSTSGGAADKDVNKAGKVIGFDVLRFVFDPKTNTASIGVAITTAGGFLYGVLHQPGTSPVAHGTVTGGTGIYAGATGTITATSNQTGSKTAVAITYQT